jgi:phenylacetate-CoA ligase
VVISDLHNFASPLIRYEIGDYAEVGKACPCGRGLGVLTRIHGRARNMLSLPDGGKIWPSFPETEMLAAAPVRQFQIVQHDTRRIEAKIVAEGELSEAQTTRLRDYLTGYLGGGFDLELSYPDEIPRGPSGKYEDFMSLLEQ